MAKPHPGKFPLGKIVEIEWMDHCGKGGWSKPDHYLKEPLDLCRSVGYLLSESGGRIVLMQSMAKSGNINDCIIIDKRTVSHRRVLGKTKGRL